MDHFALIHHDSKFKVPFMEVDIQQAATILGISPSTLRCRIDEGSLKAHQSPTLEGLTWLVELPEDKRGPEDMRLKELVNTLRNRVDIQAKQLAAKDRQIEQLRIFLQQATLAGSRRRWWIIW